MVCFAEAALLGALPKLESKEAPMTGEEKEKWKTGAKTDKSGVLQPQRQVDVCLSPWLSMGIEAPSLLSLSHLSERVRPFKMRVRSLRKLPRNLRSFRAAVLRMMLMRAGRKKLQQKKTPSKLAN